MCLCTAAEEAGTMGRMPSSKSCDSECASAHQMRPGRWMLESSTNQPPMHLTMHCPRRSGNQNLASGSEASLVCEHHQQEMPICNIRCFAVQVLRPQLPLENCRWNSDWSLPACASFESARVLGSKPRPHGRHAIRTEIGGPKEPDLHDHVGNH